MVNVSNGNLLVQAADLNVPERGINFTFGRTYNSQSTHDHMGTDGSIPSAYGDGWTNSLDAHLAYNASLSTISVYDVDGARYDYTSNGTSWTAPPGQHAVLAYDGGCGYTWTKKTGVQLVFYSPSATSCAGLSGGWQAGYSGRLTEIVGRNITNYIQLTYSWANGNASSAQNLTGILAQHSDGQALTLAFGAVNGYPELASITLPDGQTTITYSYDSSNRLIDVSRPGNNAATQLPESYSYGTGYVLAGAAGPRATISEQANGGTITDGDAVLFTENSSEQVTLIQDKGVVNFTPSDGTGALLQPAFSSGLEVWRSETFSGYNGTTTVGDSYGHARAWTYDSSGRAIQLQAWSSANSALVTNAVWDAGNDLVSVIDARGNETDYAYDGKGNRIAAAAPSVSTSEGTLRPTATFSYDQYNNVTAACDPVDNAQNSRNWTATPAPSDSLCPVGTGATGAAQYVYDYADSNEPYGLLANTYSPLGYEETYTYSAPAQFDDFGIPTGVAGTTISQIDGTTRTPTQTFSYDAFGDVTSFSDGSGTTTIAYNALNRPIEVTDADGHSSYTYYNPDGSVSKTETPYQHANGWGSTIGYDVDGNAISRTIMRQTSPTSSPTPETTYSFYDGEDRLVDVKQPQDPSYDTYTNPWITRYLYDVSQSVGVSFSGGAISFQAYGNLYKTQELLTSGSGPVTQTATTPQSVVNAAFQDLKGSAYDGLDRAIAKYSFIDANGGTADSVLTETLTYDGTNEYGTFPGQLTSDCTAVPQCSYQGYDALDRVDAIGFSDATPSRLSKYDPDGRTASITSSTYGSQAYTYDADGNKLTEQEATGGGVTSPATFTHVYYPDGTLQQLNVTSSGLTQTALLAYSYRADGLVQTQTINDAAQSNVGSTSVAFTYYPSGRPMERAESGPGGNPNPTTWQYDAYGRLSQVSYPACTSCNNEPTSIGFSLYDPQGLILTSTLGTNSLTNYQYTARGEFEGTLPLGGPTFFANGIDAPAVLSGSGSTAYSTTWDSQSGARVSGTSYTPGNSFMSPNGTTSNFTYDQAGRLTTDTASSSTASLYRGAAGTKTLSGAFTATLSRTYDAENHTITSSDALTGSLGFEQGETTVYGWGPAGHPVQIGSATSTSSTPSLSSVQYDTLHWDGSQLIFETTQSGQVDDIKIGTSGDITPLDAVFNGLTFWDRGVGGLIAFAHTAAGTVPFQDVTMETGGAWLESSGSTYTVPTPTSFQWYTASGTAFSWSVGVGYPYPSGVGQGGILGMIRTDGLTDQLNTIQGVRTYDSNAGTWTTPDAFLGYDTDPAGQKAYAWNHGNPLAYQDPLGSMSCNGPCGVTGGFFPPDWGWCETDCSSIDTDLTSIDTPDIVVSVPGGLSAGGLKIIATVHSVSHGSLCAGGATIGNFPQGVNLSDVVGAGRANPVALRAFGIGGGALWLAQAWRDIGPGGTYDVQRWGRGHHFNSAYRSGANFNTGVYMAATGASLSELISDASNVLTYLEHHADAIAGDKPYWIAGYSWYISNCQ